MKIELTRFQTGKDANGEVVSSHSGDKILIPKRGPLSGGVWKSNLKCVAALLPSLRLEAGCYRFRIGVAMEETDGWKFVADLRIFGEDGKMLAIRSFRRRELEGKCEMSLDFRLKKTETVDLEVASYNAAGFTLSDAEVEPISEDEADLLSAARYMGTAEKGCLSENALYCFDLRRCVNDLPDSRLGYDIVNLVATLQGLANREKPRLFVEFTGRTNTMHLSDVDDYWLQYIRKKHAEIAAKKIVRVHSPATLLKLFSGFFVGLAVWDEGVPATVNAVSTACGVENLLPVCYDETDGSLYRYLTEQKAIPVCIDLHGKFDGRGKVFGTERESTGSAKNDAYIWAIERYLKKGCCSPTEIAYHPDAFSWDNGRAVTYFYNNYIQNYDYEFLYLCNKDFNIAQKSFFYDLFPYPEKSGYVPNDDTEQKPGTDYRTLDEIFSLQHHFAGDRMFYIHGYNVYFLKYSRNINNVPNGKLCMDGNVACEGVHGRMLSKYYASAIANGTSYPNICNQSVYYRLKRINYSSVVQVPKEKEIRPCYYFQFVMGDYDSASWPNSLMPTLWNDKARGKIPLSWLIAPFSERYIPHVYEMMYTTKTDNDYFTCSNNGAGFCSISMLEQQKLEDGSTMLDRFLRDTEREMDRMGLDIEGHLIVDFGDKDLNLCMRKYCSMKLKKKLKAVYSTYWSAQPENNWTQLFYQFNKIPVCGVEIDADALGLVEPDFKNMYSYLKQFFIFGKKPKEAQFHCIRTVLARPSVLYEAIQSFRKDGYAVEVLDPYTFAQNAVKADTKRIEFELMGKLHRAEPVG